MYEPAHPAVLSMIRRTITAATSNDIPCGVCGEMAGDPLFTETLIGMGVSSLSMSSVSIPRVRAEIADISYRIARSAARKIRQCRSYKETRRNMDRRLKRRRTMEALLTQVESQLDGDPEGTD